MQRDDTWVRLRLIRPDADALTRTGARCYERGVYESWAQATELINPQVIEVPYVL